MSRHSFHWLIEPQTGNRVRIDREIAPLLTKMWQLGIHTYNSCQAVCSRHCKHTWKKVKYADGSVLHTHTKTKYCYDRVWIAFENTKSLEKFYNYVAVYEDTSQKEGSMYDHIHGFSGKKYSQDKWEILPYIENCGVLLVKKRIPAVAAHGTKDKTIAIIEEVGCKKNNFKMMPQLRFPRKHLPYIEERLDLALAKKQKKK